LERRVEAGKGNGCKDRMDADAAAAAADKGRLAAGSVGRIGVSMEVVAEVAVVSATAHVRWKRVLLEGEELA
jgi:hypothetical protein